MKNVISKLLALALVFVLCFSLASCSLFAQQQPGGPSGNGGDNTKPAAKLSTEVYTGDVIYVGNTAGTTGIYAGIGGPFNLGIQAAFAEYNAAGGFNGKTVALKHYDDGGKNEQAIPLLETLVHEDGIFAVVGQFGTYSVDSALEILKDEAVPMIYAAAGNESLFNSNATADADRAIFPVQPLNNTEGRSLILRAFAPALNASYQLTGGLGGTKVGVISDSTEASKSLLAGIKAEAATSNLTGIIYQEVTDGDPSSAIDALKDAGCDVVIVTLIADNWATAVSKMADKGCTWSVLTSYNNASTNYFNNTDFKYTDPTTGEEKTTKIMSASFATALTNMKIYYQGWINISDVNALTGVNDYRYKGSLVPLYATLPIYVADDPATEDVVDPYVMGFTEAYWKVAELLYTYAYATSTIADPVDKIVYAFSMSYDPYALAGYIAGNLFCQGLEALEKSGKDLSRANFVAAMESQEFQIAMADKISFANGARQGVEAFALNYFYGLNGVAQTTAVTNGVSSIEDLRALLAK